MKQWRKKILCKKIEKIALFSFEMANRALKRYYLERFYNKWKHRKFFRLKQLCFTWLVVTKDGKIHKFRTSRQALRFVNRRKGEVLK